MIFDSAGFFRLNKSHIMEEPDLTVTPRSRREQLIEVVDNYKEKLRQIKGQVSADSVGSPTVGKKGGARLH